MKNSKIFMGASVVLLAVASAFTSKPSNAFLTGYTKGGTFSTCTSSYTTDCSGTNATCKTTGGVKTLFTDNTCQTAILKN